MRARPTRVPGTALVLVGIASVQIGNAWADTLFDRVGPGGAGFARLAWAALILAALSRPRLSGRGREQWWAAVGLGLVLAAMNLVFYHAIRHLPLGIAVTIEFIGPLAVAVGHSHRRLDFVWVALAALGIVSLAHGDTHHLSALGLGLAAIAGGLWGGYILLQRRLGRVFDDTSGLALAMGVAALVATPDGVMEGGASLLHGPVVLIGLGVGVLSSVIPYTLELTALRRIPAGVFSVLMSLEPAAAAIAGAIILSQSLSVREMVGMALVSAASLGASLRGRDADPGSPPASDADLAEEIAQVGV